MDVSVACFLQFFVFFLKKPFENPDGEHIPGFKSGFPGRPR